MTQHLHLKHIMQPRMWILIGFIGLTWGMPAICDEIVDRIVAVVNDDIITYLEVQEEMSPYEAQIKAVGYDPEKEQQMLYRVRNDIVKKLVDKKITDQEIKRHKITISDEEIDNNIEQIKKDKLWTDEDFREALEREGMTVESYRKNVKEQALRARLLNTTVKSKIVITKEDVAAYYAKNIEKYQGERTYHLRNIIMRVLENAGTDEKQAVFKKMENVHAALDNGTSFESLAREYSESSLSKSGGDLGSLPYKDFSPQLKEALDSLSIGEYTTVLDTDQGYQIFYIENMQQENVTSLEEVYEEIEEILYRELSEKAFNDWLEALREASHIKVIL